MKNGMGSPYRILYIIISLKLLSWQLNYAFGHTAQLIIMYLDGSQDFKTIKNKNIFEKKPTRKWSNYC